MAFYEADLPFTNCSLTSSLWTDKSSAITANYNKLSYRKQSMHQLRAQYVEGIYSNAVTLKSRLEVTKGYGKWYHLKAWYSFLFVFHSNYGAILYCLRHLARYWSKISRSLYPTCISHPFRGWPHQYFATMFELIKLEWLGYRVVKKLWQYVKPFRRNTGTWWTDGQTNRIPISISCVSNSVLTRDNKRSK